MNPCKQCQPRITMTCDGKILINVTKGDCKNCGIPMKRRHK